MQVTIAQRVTHKPVTPAILRLVLQLTAFLLPFQAFSFYVGGITFEPAYISIIFIVFLFYAGVLARIVLAQRLKTSERWLLMFVFVALLSILVSGIIFGWSEATAKGIRQLVGILLMVLFFFATRSCASDPVLFARIFRALWVGLVLLALGGALQFVLVNVFGAVGLSNAIYNAGPLAGRIRSDYFGSIYRVTSFAAEPAFYSQFLLLGMGTALVRLYPPRSSRKSSVIRPRISRLTALAIFICYLFSFSLVALFGLLVLIVTYVVLVNRSTGRRILSLLLGGAILLSAFIAMDKLTDGVLSDKAKTISAIVAPDEQDSGGLDLSSLVLVANLQLAFTSLTLNPFTGFGIGGHPAAFSRYAPLWAGASPELSYMSVEDGGALTIRLISETGLIGLFLFSVAFLLLLVQAVRSIQRSVGQSLASPVMAVSIGLLVSAVALLAVYMLRMGSLYQPSFWMLFGLVSAIPNVLRAEAERVTSWSTHQESG